MANVRAAAIYTRISSDDGTALGVKRQENDCRRLAADLGWGVAEVYEDNDVSAWTGKRRDSYERMLDDVRAGSRDALLCYHPDRLTRRPIELEQFVQIVTGSGVGRVRFVAGGDVDVADGDGLLVLRIQAATAANESASKSRRVLRKMVEVAESGRPHGGPNRPFGFEDDKITQRPAEAEVIRTLVARYLAGESLRSLAMWLDAEGIKTVKGGPWKTTSLRLLLRSGRIAGLREHKGEVIAEAVWDPIISPADRDRVLARFAERARSGRRTPQRYLLSGLLRCGRCGNSLYSSARKTASGGRTRRYVCESGPDHGGCGRLTVVAEPLEELLTDAVLFRLDTPELADALTGRAAADIKTAEMSEALSAAKVRLDELADLYGTGQITAREWMAARNPIESETKDLERRLRHATNTDHLAGLVGNGVELRRQWTELPLSRQHAIIAAVLGHAVIAPATPGARTLDRSRVDPVWRL